MSEGSLPLYQVKFVEIVLCICDFMPTKKQHLPLKTGDVIYVLSRLESGWCDGIIVDQPNRGTICQRGWFPYNHVKSLKERRHACPLQSGGVYQFYSRANSIMRNNTSTPTLRRETSGMKASGPVESSTSPAVNLVRVPSLTPNDTHASPQISASSSPSSYQSHIKQDYRLDMKYKPLHNPIRSSPTGANTRSSSKSALAELMPVDPLQRLTVEEESALQPARSKPATAAIGNEKIKVMSVAEVEMLLNSLGSFRCVPIWSPVSTDDGEIVFYNKDYNVYCRTLPLLQAPELNYSSVLPNDDHLIDLKPRKLDSSKTSGSETLVNNANIGNQAQGPRIGAPALVYSRKAPSYEGTPVEGQSPRRVIKKYSTDGEVPWQSQSSVYLSKDELFFHHQADIRSWTELRDSLLYQIGLSHDYLIRSNQAKFHRLMGQVSTYLSMYLISCRILRNQLDRGRLCKDIYRSLKRLIALLSRILLNATIYFSSSGRFQYCSTGSGNSALYTNVEHRDNKASCSSQNTTLTPLDHHHCASAFDIPTFTPNDLSSVSLRNLSTSTMEAALRQHPSPRAPPMQPGTSPPLRENEPVNEFSPQATNKQCSASTSAPKKITEERHNTISEDGSNVTADATLHTIERAFAKFRYEVSKLHKLFRSDDVLADTLPQVYPRLFKNSYDGGAWVNPFAQNTTFSQGSSLEALAGEAVAENSSIATGSVGGVQASTLSVRQLSNTSTKTSSSTFNKNRDRTFSRSKIVRKVRYPLNGDTVKLFKSKLTHLVEKHERSEYYVLNQPKSRNRDLELAATTYETIALLSSLIDIMEALDLTFFINLRNLPNSESMANLDKESMDLRDHCVATVTALLLEFFDVKQASHDIGIGIIVDTQHLTLRDPYVFSSMRGDLSDDKEDDQSRYQYIKHEKLANILCRHLIKQDVEYNDMNFLDTDYVVLDSMNKLLQIMELSAHVIEQLVSERENILHYAARLMKNDLIAELIKGEQEQWFEEEGSSESKRSSYNIPVFINTSHVTRDADIPWYLDNRYEYLMVYDSEGNIKGGTKEALIEHLTNHLAIDTSFNITILITFRSMFTTTEFLNLLIERYNLYPPEGLSYEEYNIWVEKKHIPIKVRVVNILKSWFKYYWSPAYYVPDLEELLSFAQLVNEEQIMGADGLFELVSEAIAHKNNVDGFVPKRVPFTIESSNVLESTTCSPSPPLLHAASLSSVSSSASLSNAFRLKKLKLLDIEPGVFAKQLTIKENVLYCKIQLFECLDRTWRTRYCNFGGSVNISSFIRNSNHLTNFVSFMIVKQTDLKRRIQIIQYFIGVAEHCRQLNNFSSMTAIVSAMFSSSVYRLKRTWSVVPESCKETLEKLNTLMDSTRNFSRYREQLESIGDVPCVPFFGVYLSDLTFTAGGNPDFLNGTTDVINVGKRFRIVNVLKEIDSYQRFSYKLKRLSDVQGFIDEQLANVQSIEKQYEQSLRIEPRSEDSTGLKTSSPRYHEKQGSMPWKGKKLRFVTRMKRSTGSAT